MGSWGYYPSDSDGALDYLGIVDDTINQKLTEIFNKKLQGKWAIHCGVHRAGLVQLLLEKGHCIRLTIVQKAIEYLDNALDDRDFIKGWRDPEKAKLGIGIVRDEMQKLVVKELNRYEMEKRTGIKRFTRKHGGKICPPTIFAPKDWLEKILLPKNVLWLWQSQTEIKSRREPSKPLPLSKRIKNIGKALTLINNPKE